MSTPSPPTAVDETNLGNLKTSLQQQRINIQNKKLLIEQALAVLNAISQTVKSTTTNADGSVSITYENPVDNDTGLPMTDDRRLQLYQIWSAKAQALLAVSP